MDTINGVLFNLRTIANIEQGKKLSTAKEFITIDDNSTFQWWRRGCSGDSRDRTVNAICKDIRFAITIANLTMESRHLYGPQICGMDETENFDVMNNEKNYSVREERIQQLKKIRDTLSSLHHGIDNICTTYKMDADVDGHLRPLKEEIDACCQNIVKLLITLGEHLDD